jgi:hypothetical protein
VAAISPYFATDIACRTAQSSFARYIGAKQIRCGESHQFASNNLCPDIQPCDAVCGGGERGLFRIALILNPIGPVKHQEMRVPLQVGGALSVVCAPRLDGGPCTGVRLGMVDEFDVVMAYRLLLDENPKTMVVKG